MKQEMLINVAQAEECRIAIVEDGLLEELYLERSSQHNYVGNIYKGRIVNLEPSIQAAFVDFGVGRNGFLHISDVEAQYFRQGGYDPKQADHAGRQPVAAAARRDGERRRRGRRGRRRRTRAQRRRNADGADAGRRAAADQAADPGDFSARRRSARAGDQGRHRHEGADALDVHQHSGAIPGADAGAGSNRRVAEDRERRGPAAAARHFAGAESAEGRGLHRAHGRHRPDEEGAVARPGVFAAVVEGDCAADQERRPARWASTKKAT